MRIVKYNLDQYREKNNEKKLYIYQSRGLYLAAIRNDSKVHFDNDNFVIVKLLPRDMRKKNTYYRDKHVS